MIQDIIEEGEKEFENKFVFIPPPEDYNGMVLLKPYEVKGSVADIKNWYKSQQHKLLQSIVEEIEGMKKEVTYFQEDNRYYNQALSDLKAKLLEGKNI